MPRVEVYLETDLLLLRRLTDADAESLFLLDSDPAVMRFRRPDAIGMGSASGYEAIAPERDDSSPR